MGEDPKTITIDLTEPKIRDSMTALEHIQTAMNLLNKNEGTWSSLAQAKTSLEKQIGTMLFYRAESLKKKVERDGQGEHRDPPGNSREEAVQ